MLYGNKLIKNDSCMRMFAKSVMDLVSCEYENKDDYMDAVFEVLHEDISRTDIDYPALMRKYSYEIGDLLCEMENQGYDISDMKISFFDEKIAKECFNRFVMLKIELMKFPPEEIIQTAEDVSELLLGELLSDSSDVEEIQDTLEMSEELKAREKAYQEHCNTNVMPKWFPMLWLRDTTDGTEHLYGTDVHDSLYLDHEGNLQYHNMQNGEGTGRDGDYEFVDHSDREGEGSILHYYPEYHMVK